MAEDDYGFDTYEGGDYEDYQDAIIEQGQLDDEGMTIPNEEEEDEDDTSVPVERSVKRKTITILRGDERQTKNFMTKYEFTRIVGALANLYANNVIPVHQELAKKLGDKYDPLDIAEVHVKETKLPIPIDIERPLPTGYVEIWDPREMVMPFQMLEWKL